MLGIKSTMNDEWQLNLRKLLDRGIQTQPKGEIVTRLIEGGYERMNYIEMKQRATCIANALYHRLHIRPGDRIGTLMWNNGAHFILFYAIPSMGAVLHTLNHRLHSKDLTYIIQHADDRVLFVDASLLNIIENLPSQTFQNVKQIIVTNDSNKIHRKTKLKNVISFEEFEKLGDNHFDWPELDERTGCGLCYTSGTTGNPKGVMHSHRSTFLHTLMILGTDVMNLSGTDCILPIVPMFHVYAWSVPFAAMALGFKMILQNETRTPRELLQMCVDEETTVILGVPTIMHGLREELSTFPAKYQSLKGQLTRLVCGGSAPSNDMIKWFYNTWKMELIQIWGMTEMGPLGTIGRRYARRRDLHISEEENDNQQRPGLVLPGVEAKIVKSDDLNTTLAWDGKQKGELLVRGPWVTKEYFANSAPTNVKDGWLVTGDVASFTEHAQLIIRDRSKDVVKSGGEWIETIAMENLIMSLPAIERACVVGVSHPQWSERPVIVAQLKPDQSLDYADVIQLLKTKYASWQLPDELLIWKEIPLVGTGKIDKKQVRDLLKKQNYLLPSLRKKTTSKL